MEWRMTILKAPDWPASGLLRPQGSRFKAYLAESLGFRRIYVQDGPD
jgi:hypothetical protein